MDKETTEVISELFRQAKHECHHARTGLTIQYLEQILAIGEGDEEFMRTEIYRLTQRNLGTLYHKHDEHWKVGRHIRRAIELGEAETNDLCRKLGVSEFLNDEYINAVEGLKKAVEFDPTDELSRDFLACSYRKLADSARSGFERVRYMRLEQKLLAARN